MKRILPAFLASALLCGGVYADDVREYTYLMVWNSDSTYNTYKCADRPVVYCAEDYLQLKVNDTEVSYPANQALKFTFSKTEQAETGINTPSSEGLFDITQKNFVATGLAENVKAVSIYSVDGKRVMQKNTSGGSVAMDISMLKAGIYVVQCGSVNFKFLKK